MKCIQDFGKITAFILVSCIKLSVGKCSRTALTELHVALRIQNTLFPEAVYGENTAVSIQSPLQNQGLKPGPCKKQGTEHAGRTESDNDGPISQRRIPRLREVIVLLLLYQNIGALCPFCSLFLILYPQVYRIRKKNIVLFSRIQRAADNIQGEDLLRRNVQKLCRLAPEILRCMFQR